MSISFYPPAGNCRPKIRPVDNGNMSIYEKICYTLEKIQEIIDVVNEFSGKIDSKEDSVNITNNRKLSEIGDFTGTWFGDSKANIDQKFSAIQTSYDFLIDFLNSSPTLNITYRYGGFVTDTPDTTIVGGNVIDTPTEYITGGYFIPPCSCE